METLAKLQALKSFSFTIVGWKGTELIDWSQLQEGLHCGGDGRQTLESLDLFYYLSEAQHAILPWCFDTLRNLKRLSLTRWPVSLEQLGSELAGFRVLEQLVLTVGWSTESLDSLFGALGTLSNLQEVTLNLTNLQAEDASDLEPLGSSLVGLDKLTVVRVGLSCPQTFTTLIGFESFAQSLADAPFRSQLQTLHLDFGNCFGTDGQDSEGAAEAAKILGKASSDMVALISMRIAFLNCFCLPDVLQNVFYDPQAFRNATASL